MKRIMITTVSLVLSAGASYAGDITPGTADPVVESASDENLLNKGNGLGLAGPITAGVLAATVLAIAGNDNSSATTTD
jgi:hypothetical protein